MAKNNETTTKFMVDISELKKAMQTAKRQVAIANSEFKEVASTMDDWTKSSTGLAAKLKQLDSNLKSQKSILSDLEKQYELTVAEMGEGSKAADDLKIKINNQKAVINTTEREIAKYKTSLDEVSEAEKTAAKTGKTVEEVLDDTGEAANDAEGGFTTLKGAVATFAGNVLTELASALKEGITQLVAFGDTADKAMDNLQAKTGMSASAVEGFEDVMARIYNANYGESFEDIAEAMSTVMQMSGDLGADEIEELTKQAILLRDTFDFDISESMRAVNMLMSQFGISSEEAFDLVAKGAQTGLNKNGDLLDVINEYSSHYAQMGVDAEGFFNSLINGTAAGTFSVDKLGDAFKEFGIRAKDGSDSTAEAFEALGLTVADNSESIEKAKDEITKYKDQIAKLEQNIKYAQMQQSTFTDKTSELTKVKTADNIASWSAELEELKKQLGMSEAGLKAMEDAAAQGGQSAGDLFARFAEGGESAQVATQEVFTALAGMEDKVAQDAAGVALFGSMWEDLGKEGVFALMDISNQSGALDDVYGTMAEIDEIQYSSVGEAFQEVGRNLQTGLLMPISDKLLPVISEMVADFKEWLNSPEIQEGIKNLTDSITKFIQEGVVKLQEFVSWFLANKDAVIAGLVAIAAGFMAFKVVSLIQGVQKAMEGMTVAQWLLNAAMNANPIGLIVAAIAALVAGFIYLWNNCDGFREFWINLWENIKSACGVAIEGIGKFFTETIPNFFSGLLAWIKENWDTLLLMLINPFAGLFKYFYENNTKFKEFVDTAINYIKELPEKFKEFVSKIPYYLGYVIGLAIGQLVQWGLDLHNFATTKIPEFIDKIIEFFTQLPAKIETWLLTAINKVSEWGANLVSKGKEAAKDFIAKAVEMFTQLPSKINTWLQNTITKITTWGTNLATKGKEAGKKLLDSIVEKAEEIPDKLKSIGSDIVKGLWNGINDMTSWIGDKISSFGEGVVSGLKDFFGIASPSKLMRDEIGRWLPEGIAVGIDKNAKSVLSSMKDLAMNTVGAVSSGLSTATVGTTGGIGGTVYNYQQIINSPKALSRLDIYRQSKNLLGYAGGGR